MTVNKRKKAVRYRGSKTCGGGSKKKRRGAGNRGGRGLGGSGKRADSKKPSLWKARYFGKYGFVSRKSRDVRVINVGYLDENIDKLNSQNKVSKEGEFFSIDIKKLGFDKLLSNGKVTNKYKIKAP